MSVTAEASGTQSASIGTEHILSDVNSAGVYTFHVDLVNLADGDLLELRVYQMVLTGGTRRGAMFASYWGAQPADHLIKVFLPISNELTDSGALRFSLKQVAGTGRSFPWKVLKHA